MVAADGTLGIYAHVPFCKHACPYCDFYKLELRDRPARARLEFPELLSRELELLLSAMPELRERELATIYFGGGTPSTLVPAAVGAFIAETRGAFRSAAVDLEIVLEANPENLTQARAGAWRAAGITRLSIGVQSFQPSDLSRLERMHAPPAIANAVRNARAAGIANLSLDLMFALPGQTLAEWSDNLRRALELEPQHVSFYGLTVHEETPFHAEQERGGLVLPDEDRQAEMYEAGAEALTGAGFVHYEISNFARPGFESRHNRRYWSRADVLALGPSAHSSVGDARWHNPPDIDRWRSDVVAGRLPREAVDNLDERARLQEALFCNLRRREGILREERPDLAESVSKWLSGQPAGFVERHFVVTRGSIALSRAGWLVSDAIISRIAE